ncbi:hypothetical protein [Streptomyces sp. NPDC052107]|uniref:hypothetical protein n=1 Tax=Streptomyces sp. NPDC052107 TaxID=3155632 RepID=UPI0034385206
MWSDDYDQWGSFLKDEWRQERFIKAVEAKPPQECWMAGAGLRRRGPLLLALTSTSHGACADIIRLCHRLAGGRWMTGHHGSLDQALSYGLVIN